MKTPKPNTILIDRREKFGIPRDAFDPCETILVGFRGSVAHGMYIDPENPFGTDDIDLMGVFIPKLNHYFGLSKREHQESFIAQWDVVNYEIRKMFRLLLKSNPNVLSLLWIDEKDIVFMDILGKMMRDNRHLFVTKEAYKSFCGYANGQLHRLQHFSTKGYMGVKRKRLVDEFGFDTKNASHLIRLLRMGKEFLQTGELLVKRPDAAELLEIKTGKWTLEHVKSESDRLFQEIKEIVAASSLPEKPNVDAAEILLIKILMIHFGFIEPDPSLWGDYKEVLRG